MSCKVLNRLRVHPCIEKIGNVSVPQLMRGYIKVQRISDYVIADSKGEPLAASQFQRVWQYVVVRSTSPGTIISM